MRPDGPCEIFACSYSCFTLLSSLTSDNLTLTRHDPHLPCTLQDAAQKTGTSSHEEAW